MVSLRSVSFRHKEGLKINDGYLFIISVIFEVIMYSLSLYTYLIVRHTMEINPLWLLITHL